MKRLGVLLLVGSLAACSPTLPGTSVAQGDSFSDAGLTMTVVDGRRSPQLSEEYFPGQWFVVDVEVSAVDRVALFNGMNQQLFIDGDEYLPDPSAAEFDSSSTGSGASLLPGGRATVALAFNLGDAKYTDSPDVRLVMRGEPDSSGVVVTLPATVLD